MGRTGSWAQHGICRGECDYVTGKKSASISTRLGRRGRLGEYGARPGVLVRPGVEGSIEVAVRARHMDGEMGDT